MPRSFALYTCQTTEQLWMISELSLVLWYKPQTQKGIVEGSDLMTSFKIF